MSLNLANGFTVREMTVFKMVNNSNLVVISIRIGRIRDIASWVQCINYPVMSKDFRIRSVSYGQREIQDIC
jgi:hypothetical protein